MRALWITTTLCLASTAVVAQPANPGAVGLDTCFKLVRVAEANCSNSADDAAQRRACLQNGRKVQLECLELAGLLSPTSGDRPQMAAGAVPSDRPAVVSSAAAVEPSAPVNPAAGASTDQKASEPARILAAAPSEKSDVAASPVATTASISTPSGTQASDWTVSETTSPVDYSPLVTATLLPQPGTKDAAMALVARCRGRRTELGLRSEGALRASRGDEILVAHQVNDQPMVKLRWTASADGKTASYREDAVALLQSFSDGGQFKIAVPDGSGQASEATFQLAGWNAIRNKIATACMWASTASNSSQRR